MLLLSLPGTLTIYYGEELGMQDVLIPPDEVQDPAEKRQPGIGMGRDPERTPLPWDDSPQCGFTGGMPWLPIGEANRAVNVQSSRIDPDSTLSLYRRLLQLRRKEPVLVSGVLTDLEATEGLLQFSRSSGNANFKFVMNLGEEPRSVVALTGTISACTNRLRDGQRVNGRVELDPAEAMIIKIENR